MRTTPIDVMRTVVDSENLKTLFKHIEIATMLPLQSVTVPKEGIVEGQEWKDVTALGLLRPARLLRFLRGVVSVTKPEHMTFVHFTT